MSFSARLPAGLLATLAAVILALCGTASTGELSEENLPSQEMPSPVASPLVAPTGGSASVPLPLPMTILAAPVPLASAPPPLPAAPPAPPQAQREAAAAAPPPAPQTAAQPAAAQPSLATSPAGSGPQSADAAGASAAAGDLPPMDFSTATAVQVSESPLTDLINEAKTPARAASLRLTEQARQQVLSGKASEAIHSLTRALSIDSSNPYAYFYLGRAYLLRKGYRQALTFFQRAEIGLSNDQTWLAEAESFEGACYEQLGQTDQAAAAYKRALDSSPYNLMARAGYGRLAPAPPDTGLTPGGGVAPPPAMEVPGPPTEAPPQAAPAEPSPQGAPPPGKN